LYYLQNRYYNPEWGRFINADAIIGVTGEYIQKTLPESIVHYSNREAKRHANSVGRWIVPATKVVSLTRTVAGFAALGIIMLWGSIRENYTSGHGFWKATALSGIDVLTSGLSIVAGVAFPPVGGFVAGVALGSLGDIAKDAIIRKD
jgi:hypothetical protein